MKTLVRNTLKTYTMLYHTYQLLYCKGDVQITSGHSTIKMEKNNRFFKMETLD